jgi:CopG family transcriptional regulator, nickel-responsive regulator
MSHHDDTIRFSVSLPGTLLTELDDRYIGRGYSSRSELVRDLIRKEMVQDVWATADSEVFGVLCISYDHHQGGLTDKLHTIQHNDFVHVLCTQHVHIDHYNCIETIVLRGNPEQINTMAMEIGGLKGVKYSELVRMGLPA